MEPFVRFMRGPRETRRPASCSPGSGESAGDCRTGTNGRCLFEHRARERSGAGRPPRNLREHHSLSMKMSFRQRSRPSILMAMSRLGKMPVNLSEGSTPYGFE